MRALGGVVLLVALTVLAVAATWMWRAGPEAGLVAMGRLLAHGPTTVDDFRVYPARELHPLAPRPWLAATPAPSATAGLPSVPGADGRPVALDGLLADSGTLALVVVRRGTPVHAWGASGHREGAPSQWFSVSKTVLATLVGMAVADGRLRSLDQPVGELVPELAPRFPALTLRHLLDMRSGIAYTENDNPFGLHVLLNYTADLRRMVLALQPAGPPGGPFVYRSGDTALLSLALQRALGAETLTAYAQRRLWTPLGMQDGAVWTLDREGGFEKAWCCLAGSARDLARIGQLVLDGGLAGGQRLLPAEAVDAWICLPAGADGRRAYRGAWWPASADGRDVMAAGKDGQFLYVDPATGTVVARLGRSDGGLTLWQWGAVFAALARHAW